MPKSKSKSAAVLETVVDVSVVGTDPVGLRDVDLPVVEDAPVAFVKLPKDQLPARGTAEREAYRKARRHAARLARRAKRAAEAVVAEEPVAA